ncbi:MAG TPA: CHAD domain-containing protein [Chthoniobacteraceae bacterium]|nr:CHAD domain-containing protein [Chthoniobacteraceae bacterium]
MSYQISKSKPVGRELKRVAAAQMGRARKALSQKNGAVAVGIHTARTRLKKTRALLRMAKAGLGRKEYRKENHILRDAGRDIRDARDGVALVEALDAFTAECFEGRPPEVLLLLRRILAREAKRLEREVKDGGVLKRAARQVRKELKRVKEWDLNGFDKKDARHAWRKARKAFRRAHQTADAEPTPENLHEWRKRTKELWNETLLLRKKSPDLGERADQIGSLAQLLGKDRDLGLLGDVIHARRDRLAHPAQCRAVLRLLTDRQKQLQTAAFLAGAAV